MHGLTLLLVDRLVGPSEKTDDLSESVLQGMLDGLANSIPRCRQACGSVLRLPIQWSRLSISEHLEGLHVLWPFKPRARRPLHGTRPAPAEALERYLSLL
jgi:hypothetical protein